MDLKTVEVSDDSSSSNSMFQILSDLSSSQPESFDSRYEELMEKYVKCVEELKTTSLKFQESEQEIEKLKKKEYESEIMNIVLETKQREMVDLENELLRHSQISLCTVITKQQIDIDGLLSNLTYLESKVRAMEDRIEKSDAEKLELKIKEVELQCEIKGLETDLDNQDEHIEALKKESEMHKQSYDNILFLFLFIAALVVFFLFISCLKYWGF